MSDIRDNVAKAGAKVARAKLNLAMAEAELSQAMDQAMAAPKSVRAVRPVTYGVKLVLIGHNKIQIIKVVREHNHLGLLESKNLVESCVPYGFQPIIKENIEKELAEKIRHDIEAAGGRAEVFGRRYR
jgi:ribosomal protein L7/L12